MMTQLLPKIFFNHLGEDLDLFVAGLGFQVLYELAFDPDAASTPGGKSGAVTYWGVADTPAAFARLIALGAVERSAVQEVGDGIRVATVFDPFGNIFWHHSKPAF